jgi:hypothetical protein
MATLMFVLTFSLFTHLGFQLGNDFITHSATSHRSSGAPLLAITFEMLPSGSTIKLTFTVPSILWTTASFGYLIV